MLLWQLILMVFYVTSVDMMTLFNNANELEAMLDELQDCTISNTLKRIMILLVKNGAVIGTLKRNKAVTITANSGLIVGGWNCSTKLVPKLKLDHSLYAKVKS